MCHIPVVLKVGAGPHDLPDGFAVTDEVLPGRGIMVVAAFITQLLRLEQGRDY